MYGRQGQRKIYGREKWETESEEDLWKGEMGDRVRGRSMEGRNGRQGQRKVYGRKKWETGPKEDLWKGEMGDRVRGRSMEGRNGRQGQRKLVMCDLSNGCHCLWNLLVRKVSDHRLLIVPSLVFLLFLKTNKHLKSFHISDIRLFLELLC